ncbi:hypothetical protein DFAR_2330020 [Desulfarculales bacterium]
MGEVRAAHIFVGVLGASNYSFAEATRIQSLPDWIGSQRLASQRCLFVVMSGIGVVPVS